MMSKLNIKIFSTEFNRLLLVYDKEWKEEKRLSKSREYYDKLQHLSEDSFKTGVDKCIVQYKYFPSISEMLDQCRITRGSQEFKSDSKIISDNSSLDILWESLKMDEKKTMKQMAADLMKRIGILPNTYKKGVNPWYDRILSSTFNSSFKYIVLRKYLKEECEKFGYRWKGECLSGRGWMTFEQTFERDLIGA